MTNPSTLSTVLSVIPDSSYKQRKKCVIVEKTARSLQVSFPIRPEPYFSRVQVFVVVVGGVVVVVVVVVVGVVVVGFFLNRVLIKEGIISNFLVS